jgi:ATP phosphoribosyltransferase regulatory subunit
LQTFKLTDQLSGRMMGVRADVTPQAARIDASRMPEDQPVRLCYIGRVLRTRPEGLGGSRSPLQVGVELFGHAGLESDIEVMSLMLGTLETAGIEDVHLDLGHVGIYRALVRAAALDEAGERILFDILQRKAAADLDAFIQARRPASPAAEMLRALIGLNGDAAIIDEARRALKNAQGEVKKALDALACTAEWLKVHRPSLPLHIDLAELRGYSYHTGMVYAAFVPGRGNELARGGRYDNVGAAFGRARPATGFSADLTQLAAFGETPTQANEELIYAPAQYDEALEGVVRKLRAQGRRVLKSLPGEDPGPGAMGCTHTLTRDGADWAIRPLNSE